MKADRFPPNIRHTIAAGLLASGLLWPIAPTTRAQPATTPSLIQPPRSFSDASATSLLAGRTVEDVRVVGNTQVSTNVILNLVRTHEGDKFDPATVAEDYQRIFGLRKFSNVEAKVEPTARGVIVVFVVSEQRQITVVAVRGNRLIEESAIRGVIDIQPGEAIDRFRVSLVRQSIENLYKGRNFPFAHVDVDQDLLSRTGELAFKIVEGPNVRIRRVNFVGNQSFSDDRLKDQVQSKYWIWILRPGTLDLSQVEDDVGAVRRYYEQHGFFDVRVGRKIIFSPDQTEAQIDFVIEEGARYKVDRISFKGNSQVPEVELRKNLKLVEGEYWDGDLLQRDVRQIVRTYSPFGYIYQPGAQDPDYLRVEPKPVYRDVAGNVELVYDISEGKPFRQGNVLIKGNSKTQDKVLLRELRISPGQLYNSGEWQDAIERLRATPFFSAVGVTPVGDDTTTRDSLIEVKEQSTARVTLGAGVNSNGGLGGNLTYEQRNFDITNLPSSFGDVFSDRSLTGAGQTLRISLEPGTEQTNASIRFVEPYIFDQPYSFSDEIYLRTRQREDYDDERIGTRIGFGKRFDYVYSANIFLRGEDVHIRQIDDKPFRSQEILDAEGHTTLTSVGLTGRRDTTNRGLLPSTGSTTTLGVEQYGALGGELNFTKLTAGYDQYWTLAEDLLDRKTILSFHGDVGWIPDNSVFFERFYAGGIGSLRGYAFRGVSPRDGPFNDRIGGNFMATGSVEVSYPLIGDTLRGVVFTDFGTVERDVRLGTIRSSIGTGVRLTLPFLGQTPIAVDLALPLSKNSDDDTRIFSFSLGFTP